MSPKILDDLPDVTAHILLVYVDVDEIPQCHVCKVLNTGL